MREAAGRTKVYGGDAKMPHRSRGGELLWAQLDQRAHGNARHKINEMTRGGDRGWGKHGDMRGINEMNFRKSGVWILRMNYCALQSPWHNAFNAPPPL